VKKAIKIQKINQVTFPGFPIERTLQKRVSKKGLR